MNDHQTSPQADPAPLPHLRPVRGVALYATLALALAGVAWVARAVWHVRLAVAGEPASGPPDQGEGVHRTLTSLEDSYHLVSSVGGFAVVVCVLAFLSWLNRMRENARLLSGTPPHYAGIWVYASWIVPIANLWIPRGLIADVHQKSAPGERLPWVVNVWWGLWLVGLFSGVGLVYSDSTDEVIARAYSEVWPLLASDLAVVGAAVAAIFVVRAVTAAQERRMEVGGPVSP
ncbi:DUF4328 domain-containing protein [Streptomyces pseudovenezuelae]|uniref:DUF4328 domain-containing protein n=1 Tax=Streptomyces pseudovenezuelae TaxID=67350 RepID=UPI003D794467